MMRNRWLGKGLEELYATGKKSVALLIDPECQVDPFILKDLALLADECNVGYFLVGGSLVTPEKTRWCVDLIKSVTTRIPVVLFPGHAIQLAENADGILFISLISGRNPDLLIGQHVMVASFLAKSPMEVLPTGYMLIDGGNITSVNYVSQTLPLPNNKPDLAIATALAGAFLGLRYLFLDAGSGAKQPVSPGIIKGVREQTGCPLIVGGGIDSVSKAKSAYESGADVVVLGNGVENRPGLLGEVSDYTSAYNLSLNVN